MLQPAPGKPYQEPCITVKDQKLQVPREHSFPHNHYRRRGQQQSFQGQQCLRSIKTKRLAETRDQPSHKAQSLQGCGPDNLPVCMRGMDNLQET